MKILVAVGDVAFDEIFHPVGRRPVERCDAVLRLPGTSSGSHETVEIATSPGRTVFYDIADVPAAA